MTKSMANRYLRANMFVVAIVVGIIGLISIGQARSVEKLHVLDEDVGATFNGDWLVTNPNIATTVTNRVDADGNPTVALSNGLITRTFTTSPAWGTIDWVLHAPLEKGGDQSLFRSVHSEAVVGLNGTEFSVGGLVQQRTFLAYCNRSDFNLTVDPMAFQYVNHSVSVPDIDFPWTPGTRHSPNQLNWPPLGKRITVQFASPPTLSAYKNVRIEVIYDMFDGIPSMSKQVNIRMVDGSTVPPPQYQLHPSADLKEGWGGTQFADWTSTVDQSLTLGTSNTSDNVGATFTTPTSNVSITLGTSPQKFGEIQTTIGFGKTSAPAAVDRSSMFVWGCCDSNGLYTSDSRVAIGSCQIGDVLSIDIENSVYAFKFNGNIVHSFKNTSVISVAYPQIVVTGNGYQATNIHPTIITPVVPSANVIVSSVTVELFGAMPRFGAYLTHGSAAPGNAWGGASPENSNSPNTLLFAKTDLAHGASCTWQDDYPNSVDNISGCTSCKDEGAVEPYLNCSYEGGLGSRVNFKTGETFESFRVISMVHDSFELTRQTLGRQRVTQLLAPHTTENPIFFHATDLTDVGFRATIDQMVLVGFEMMVFSFGSGFNLESADPIYIKQIKSQIDYAKSKGIEVGGYDLICLDRNAGGRLKPEWITVPAGDACFASGWYEELTSIVLNFINETGLSMLETDGPYGGETCASTSHSHHHDKSDSVYQQTVLQSQFYNEMRRLGVFVNQPDNYFFAGGGKSGMGYDEQQYSLPKWQDLSISRMGMYDDLYHFLPTQGWMFVPIGDYHAGGSEAAFGGDVQAYEFAMAQYLGAGVAACYRGARPFQSPAEQAALTKWIGFYKAHRGTLIQPVVHIRRADMQSWDGWLHVNPNEWGGVVGEVGVAMIFNPTEHIISNQIVYLPLYYTGLNTTAMVEIDGAAAVSALLSRDYGITITITMTPRSAHTVVIRKS